MRFLPTVGLYWKGSANSLNSGVSYTTQPTDVPLNALAVEKGRVFEFVRLSGTCTVGSLLFRTGTTNSPYVMLSGTGRLPYGVSMVAPTASGVWTWILKYGVCTSLQSTGTFEVGASGISQLIYAGNGSAVVSANSGYRDIISQVVSATASGLVSIGPIGECLSTSTDTSIIGFINLL